jgi:hypothetical protein
MTPAFARLLLVIFVMSCSVVSIKAQDATPSPAPSPESEETKRLRDEKTEAELRRDIAVARKAELDAKFPKPTSSPLAGTTTINDGAVIEPQMVTYLSLAYAANDLVRQLRNRGIKNLAIYNERDIKLLQAYLVIISQLRLLEDEYNGFLNKNAVVAKVAPLAAITAANSFLGGFVDVLSFLRTNVDIKGFTFDIDEAALVSEVFRAAKAKDTAGTLGLPGAVNFYYPGAFPPEIDITKDSPLLTRLEDLRILKERVQKLVSDLEEVNKKLKETEAAIKKLPEDIKKFQQEQKKNLDEMVNIITARQIPLPAEVNEDGIARIRARDRRLSTEARERLGTLLNENRGLAKDEAKAIAKLQELQSGSTENSKPVLDAKKKLIVDQLDTTQIDQDKPEDAINKLKALNGQFDAIIASLLKADDTGLNSLTSYIVAENLNAALPAKESFWLQLKVLKAGGNNRIKTNLIWDVFTGGNRLSHSGGVVVQYILYDTKGHAICADTFTKYTGYIKAGKIKNLANPVSVDDSPDRNLQLPQ